VVTQTTLWKNNLQLVADYYKREWIGLMIYRFLHKNASWL